MKGGCFESCAVISSCSWVVLNAAWGCSGLSEKARQVFLRDVTLQGASGLVGLGHQMLPPGWAVSAELTHDLTLILEKPDLLGIMLAVVEIRFCD